MPNILRSFYAKKVFQPFTFHFSKGSVISFFVDDIYHFYLDTLFDRQDILRTSHHCVQSLTERLDIEDTVHTSFNFYNTRESSMHYS